MSSPTPTFGAPTPPQEFPDKHAAPELSNDAAIVFADIRELGWDNLWIPYADIGQELLDAGLVARTIHTDGKTTYRLTAAGKRWRAA